jgi:tRNA (cytidine/uridine-2'-O-)-methyltransferase
MNVVLLEPEIHFNTGNIGRTCVGTGTTLHLVGKLGFSLAAPQIRRSGLDYWAKLDLKLHNNFETFLETLAEDAKLYFFSAEGKKSFWDAEFTEDSYLIFGKESAGLPKAIREKYQERLYQVPINKEIRSLNLGTTAAVALFEALRQTKN